MNISHTKVNQLTQKRKYFKMIGIYRECCGARNMWKKIITTIVLILIIAGAIFWYLWYKDQDHKTPTIHSKTVTVTTATAKSETWNNEVLTTGTVDSFHGIMIKAEVPGRILKVYIKSGESVQAGQSLFQLNPSALSDKLAAAKAIEIDNTSLYHQQLTIFKKGFGDSEQLKSAKADYLSGKAKISAIEAKLALTLVKAPLAGKLGLRLVKLGEYVKTGQDLIRLKVHHELRIEFSVPEVYLNQLRLGQKVNVISRAFPKKIFNGKVYAINSHIDPATRSINLRATLDINDARLYSGLFAEVYLQLDKKHQVIAIPQTAVMYSISGTSVYKVANGKAERINVVTGDRQGAEIEIKSGLKAGDTIVSVGQVKLRDGDLIKSNRSRK